MAASLERTRRRLAEIDAETVALLDRVATEPSTVDLAVLTIRSLRASVARAETYAALMLWLNPEPSPTWGGRPVKEKTDD
jgi:hypothetical protein